MRKTWLAAALSLALPGGAAAQVLLAPVEDRAPGERHPIAVAPLVPRNLNAIAEGTPRPTDGGALHLTGRVESSAPLPAGGQVTATLDPDYTFALERLHGDCFSDVGRTPLVCGCGDAEADLERLLDQRLHEAVPVARAPVAADGSFDLAGLRGGGYRLWYDAPGVFPAVGQGSAGGSPVKLLVTPSDVVRGTVMDEGGKPVAGAVVTLHVRRLPRLFDAVTPADGTFSLLAPRGADIALVARQAGFLAVRQRWEGRLPSKPVTLLLRDPRSITGVLQADGKPVAGAQLSTGAGRCTATATSDAAGRFRLERLLGTTYRVTARRDHLFAERYVHIEPEEEEHPIQIELVPRATLTVRLLDDTGRPEADAAIWFSAPNGESHSAALLPDGRHLFHDLEAGTYRIVGITRHRRSAGQDVVIGDGVDATLDLKELPPMELRGRVFAGGVSGAGAHVSARASYRTDDGDLLPGTQDADAMADRRGAFVLTLPAAGDYTLQAELEGMATMQEAVHAPHAPLTLKLARSGRIHGHLRGAPTGSKVHATLAPEGAKPGEEELEDEGTPASESATTFAFAGVAPGRYRGDVTSFAQRGDTQTWRTVGLAVTVAAGSVASPTLALLRGAPVVGRVVDAQGAPVAGVKLQIGREWQSGEPLPPGKELDHTEVVSDAEGQFQTDPLALGSYPVRTDSRSAVGVGEARAGASGFVLHVAAHRQVRGRVLRADGSPVTQFSLGKHTFQAADGRFVVPLDEVPAPTGGDEPELRAEQLVPRMLSIDLDAPHDVDLGDVVLLAPRTLRVTVTDTQRKPIANAYLLAQVDDATETNPVCPEVKGRRLVHGSGTSDSSGVATLRDLATEPFTLRVWARGRPMGRLAVDGRSTEAKVQLEAGLTLEGKMATSSRAALKSLEVCVTDANGSEAHALGPDGHFEIGSLPSGIVSVAVVSSEAKRAGPTVQVMMPTEKPIELRWP